MPRMVPVRKRARVAWRRSYGTLSPIQAIDSGTMPGPAAPDRTRQNTSTSSDPAITAPALPSAQAKVATLTTRYLP
ncbi:hypothetical protein D9M69_681800 [compost metagenome]